jgi:TonB family protein
MNKRSLNAILLFPLCAFMILANVRPVPAQSNNATPQAVVTGIWTAQDVSYAPWTFILKSDGNTLTGTVSQGRYNSTGTIATALTQPVEIYDGMFTEGVISFKCHSPGSPNRTITFTGQFIGGDEITFTRTVELPVGGDPGADGIYGLSGAQHFVARRDSGTASLRPQAPPQPPAAAQGAERGPVSATLLWVPPESDSAKISVGADEEQTRLLTYVDPEYPDLARQRGIEGNVVLHAVIGSDGRVRELRPVSGDPLLAGAAMNAVTRWRYRPVVVNGTQVQVDTTIIVPFPPGSAVVQSTPSVPPQRKYVQIDPATGDLLITYPPGSGKVEPSRWVLRNHTAPIVHVAVRPNGSSYSYEYSVANGSAASQAILGVSVRVPESAVVDSWQDPATWAHLPPVTLRPDFRRPATWLARPSGSDFGPGNMLQPGGNTVVFGLGSPAKPGFADSFYEGFGPGDPTEDMPEEVAAEVQPFMALGGGNQHRTILGPVFPPDTPRGAMAGQLLDSTQKFIDAGDLNPTAPFVREALEALRQARLPEKFENEPQGELENELLLAMHLDLQ